MALPAQEPFTGATATLTDTPWRALETGPNNRRVKTDGSGNGTVVTATLDCLEVWDNDVFSNDQYSQYVAKWTGTGTAANYIYLIARETGPKYDTNTVTPAGAIGTWYWFWSDGGSDTALLSAPTGGISPSVLGTANATTFVSGDVFKLICNGTTISVQKNGSNIISVTNSAVTSGVPGMGGSGAIGTVLFDDWEGNNVAAGGGTISVPRLAVMGVGR